jgi:hypothetical protein
MVADLRRTNHLKHTSPSSVTTTYNWTIPTMHTDRDFRTQIFTSLSSQYAMILMVLKHRKPLPTPEEAMHDLLEEETTASLTTALGDASTGAALSLNVAATVAVAVVTAVDTVEAVEPETATRVSAPIA